MNLQRRNLQQGLTGDDVRLLHSELALLNLVIPDNERLAGLFGPVTVTAIQNFQKKHNFPITGIVDAVTARAIIAMWMHCTLPRPPFRAACTVRNAQEWADYGFRWWTRNAGPDVLLAEGTTSDRGVYSISYSTAMISQQRKGSPDLQVRALAGNTLLGVSEVRYDASPDETLDIVARRCR